MVVRSRFAPSPTGYLHLGNVRTAIYAWLYAKHHKGNFVLRIEDTDRERSTQDAIDVIFEAMKWLGLDYNEGPFYQTQRFDRYREVAEQFLKEGNAYKCTCSKERLEELRNQQLENKEKPRYDGHCWQNKPMIDKDQPYVIRFRNPQEGCVSFIDDVNGEITFQNSELDDLIIFRSDGYPTYNFSVVIDDLDMNISHVIRGADHINNTPRQINIFRALNAIPPTYAHVPLILGPDGKLLSKRHGASSIIQYREEGFLPEAMINYLLRLGWSHGDQEIFSKEEMFALFDSKNIHKSPASINPDKLLWLNRHYIKTLEPEIIASRLIEYLAKLNIKTDVNSKLIDIVILLRERCETLVEMANKSKMFFIDEYILDDSAKKHISQDNLSILQLAIQQFSSVEEQNWNATTLHEQIVAISEKMNLKLGKIAPSIRVAVTGTTISPPLDGTLAILGKDIVLQRLNDSVMALLTHKTL